MPTSGFRLLAAGQDDRAFHGDRAGSSAGRAAFGTKRLTGEGWGSGLALLTDVRLGRHEGVDRIVFELGPGAAPGRRARHARLPIFEDAAGRPVRIGGEDFLSVRMEPASRFTLVGASGLRP